MNDCDLQDQDQTIESALEEGKVFDYITGEAVKDTDKERVRQRIARAIIHEYGIPAEDMEPDFRVKVGGRNKKIDIAIFHPGAAHKSANLYRVVVVEKEPKLGAKGAGSAGCVEAAECTEGTTKVTDCQLCWQYLPWQCHIPTNLLKINAFSKNAIFRIPSRFKELDPNVTLPR